MDERSRYLSNNDGCVVARSNDVKQWIKMGQPVFEVEDIIKEHGIQVFSSNYTILFTVILKDLAGPAQPDTGKMD